MQVLLVFHGSSDSATVVLPYVSGRAFDVVKAQYPDAVYREPSVFTRPSDGEPWFYFLHTVEGGPVAALESELSAANARVAELERELAAVREGAAGDRMADNAELQALRISSRKVVDAEVERLLDAEDALKHERPDVTAEFVGRAIGALRGLSAKL